MMRPLQTFGAGTFVALSAVSLGACAGASPKAPATAAIAEASDTADDEGEPAPVKTRPRDPAPAALSATDKGFLSERCASIEPVLYDAHRQGTLTLENELASGKSNEDAEKAGLEAAMAFAEARPEGLDKAVHQRCMSIFRASETRKLFDHEPVVAEARITIDSCVRRAVAAFGKERLSFSVGDGSSSAGQSPFCPDDDPVPLSLGDLPYKSSKDDWDTPTWRCLKFGLRQMQRFQLAYVADPAKDDFQCAARYLPRHGGPVVELSRGGRINSEGELIVGRKLLTKTLGN